MDAVNIVEESILFLAASPDIRVMLADIEMPGSINVIKLAFAVRDRWLPLMDTVMSGRIDPGPALSGWTSIEAIQAFAGEEQCPLLSRGRSIPAGEARGRRAFRGRHRRLLHG